MSLTPRYECCQCGCRYEAIRHADGVGCIRCWAKSAALEAMCASPHVWDTYDELTRSDFDGDGLDGFQLEVMDVVRATLPRMETGHFSFKRGYNEHRNDAR